MVSRLIFSGYSVAQERRNSINRTIPAATTVLHRCTGYFCMVDPTSNDGRSMNNRMRMLFHGHSCLIFDLAEPRHIILDVH